MTEDEKRRRAAEAERLKNDPLLVEAFDALEQGTLAELLATRGSDPEDDRKRRALVDRVAAIRDVRAHLEMVIATGKRAATQPQVWG